MRKYMFIIVGIIVLLLVFYKINTSNKEWFAQIDISEKNFDKEDSLILKEEILNKIEVESVIKSKKRNPLKFYRYDKKYNLYSTKIDLKNDTSLGEIISFNTESSSQDSFVSYLRLPSNKSYDIKFKEDSSSLVSKMILSLSGDKKQLKKIVHNEDYISYSMPLTTLSLQYESNNNPIDVFVFANGSNLLFKKKVPFVVSFYKKEKSIYLLLMTPIKKETKMNQNILEEIIKF